jgi:predicted nucleotidyltransferase
LNLVAAGILVRRVEGRQVYYRADDSCPFLPELQGLLAKTAGIVDVLRESLRRVRGIEFAFVYGSIARGEAVGESDVDLFIAGTAGLRDLAAPIRKAHERLGRDIHPTVMAVDELTLSATDKRFVSSVLRGKKLFIVGDEDGLAKAVGTAQGRTARGIGR